MPLQFERVHVERLYQCAARTLHSHRRCIAWLRSAGVGSPPRPDEHALSSCETATRTPYHTFRSRRGVRSSDRKQASETTAGQIAQAAAVNRLAPPALSVRVTGNAMCTLVRHPASSSAMPARRVHESKVYSSGWPIDGHGDRGTDCAD